MYKIYVFIFHTFSQSLQVGGVVNNNCKTGVTVSSYHGIRLLLDWHERCRTRQPL